MKFDFLKLTQHKVLIITGILIATWSHDHYCRYKPRYFTLWNGKYHSYLGHNPRIFWPALGQSPRPGQKNLGLWPRYEITISFTSDYFFHHSTNVLIVLKTVFFAPSFVKENTFSVPQGKKWPFSALRENFCSRITFNQSARRKVLFVPHSKPRIFPQTSKFPRAKPSAILRFSWKTSFLNSGTKLLFRPAGQKMTFFCPEREFLF